MSVDYREKDIDIINTSNNIPGVKSDAWRESIMQTKYYITIYKLTYL